MADRIGFEFNPIAFSRPRFANGTAICPQPGERVDGALVDTDCSVDKYETCLARRYCQGYCQGSKTRALARFLACFEGRHHANWSALEPCSREAGLDLTEANHCYRSAERDKLWKAQLAMPVRAKLQHFPTVILNGKEMDGNKTLLQNLCGLFSHPKPPSCDTATNPCAGHRCDNVACPCGCECGDYKDPGLCFQPSRS